MAAVEVMISGLLYDKHRRTTQHVMLIGEASIPGLGVGGGPIIPPGQGGGVEPPLGIWGPTDPRPTQPIAGIPGLPGYEPPQRPGNVVPPMPPAPPQQPSNPVPPEQNGGWAWHPAYGWGFFPPNQAVPKAGAPGAPATPPKP